MADDNITDDDKALFRSIMQGVKPLKKQNKHLPDQPIKTPPIIRKHKPESHSSRSISEPIHLSSHYTDEVGTDTILSYHIPGFPKKRQLELKKGEIRWEAHIDLHGLTLSKTQNMLCEFIQQQYQQGHRCVLIIHGKGSPTGEAPILKNHVNHWLKQLPQVLAFHSARPQHGGAGAVYVLLRR